MDSMNEIEKQIFYKKMLKIKIMHANSFLKSANQETKNLVLKNNHLHYVKFCLAEIEELKKLIKN